MVNISRFGFARLLVANFLFATSVGAAAAGPVAGTWLTQPDAKGQRAHVTARSCGPALCGTITKVFNSSGVAIDHPNVGQRVFWGVTQVAPGRYEGRAYVPAFQAEYPAEMTVAGGQMEVRGCLGPICKSQVWQRIE